MRILRLLFFANLLLLSNWGIGQNVDLFSEQSNDQNPDIITGTFKSSRIVNGQSIENVGAGVLDFRIAHRFGALSQGSYNLYGLDQATMRIGLDYGLASRITVGIGRSTYQKQYDAFLKVKLLQQQDGLKFIPFGIGE